MQGDDTVTRSVLSITSRLREEAKMQFESLLKCTSFEVATMQTLNVVYMVRALGCS